MATGSGPAQVIGWDIGGAHVKVAVLRERELVDVSQFACPLWLGLSHLEEVVDRVLGSYSTSDLSHAVTMTGELADLFSGRDEGVRRILGVLESRMSPSSLHVFAGNSGLVGLESVHAGHFPRIASANWLASATYLAMVVDGALFVDIGSTTTDLLLIGERRVHSLGFSDYERLVFGEMLYRGIVRTPIAALTQRVPFEGRDVPLMAEFFATTSDVYRITGDLPEEYDQWPAADGADKTLESSARRLARMIGRDFESAPLNSWRRLANTLKQSQLHEIQEAMMRQLSRPQAESARSVIGAGIGRFLAHEAAARIGLPYHDFSEFIENAKTLAGVAECAPAVSLSLLLANRSAGPSDFRVA